MLTSILVDNANNTWDGLNLLDMVGSLGGATPNICEWDNAVNVEAFTPQYINGVNRLYYFFDNDVLEYEFIVSEQQCDLLPGAVQFRGNGHTVTIVNPSHHLDPDLTEVWFDGVEITNWVVELKVEIDPDQDLISAYLIYNSLGLTVTQEFVG